MEKEKDRSVLTNNITDKQIRLANFEAVSHACDFHVRTLKVRSHGKEATERNWQTTTNYALSSPEMRTWIMNGGNYGLTCPSGFGCLVDADTEEVQRALDDKLPQTFRYSTGKMGHFQYLYFLSDAPIGCIPLKAGAYVKGRGGYALGPGSIHPNGVIYGSREIRETPIAIITHMELTAALEPFTIGKPATGHPWSPIAEEWTGEIDTAALIEILTPYWNRAAGRRNEMMLAIAGFIARSGGTPEDAFYVVSELARITGRGADHVAGTSYAFRREGPVRGLRSLDRILEVIDGAE